MANWHIISKDIDDTTNQPVGITMAMKVPGGMIVRTIMNGGPTAMVFVPMNEIMMSQGLSSIDIWINENKIR